MDRHLAGAIARQEFRGSGAREFMTLSAELAAKSKRLAQIEKLFVKLKQTEAPPRVQTDLPKIKEEYRSLIGWFRVVLPRWEQNLEDHQSWLMKSRAFLELTAGALENLSGSSSEELSDYALRLLRMIMPSAQTAIFNKTDAQAVRITKTLLAAYIVHGTDDDFDIAAEAVEILDERRLVVLVAKLLSETDDKTVQRGQWLLFDRRIAPDVRPYLEGWRRGNQKHPAVAIEYNLQAVINLEKQKPGSAKILHDQFGVVQFGRYPLAMLLEQFEERDKNDRPYWVVINAVSDHNAAFFGNYEIYNELSKKLKSNFYARIVEVENVAGLPLALMALNQRYGFKPIDAPEERSGRHNISFIMVGAHGETEEMELGGPHYNTVGKLRTDMITKPGVLETKYFFEPGAVVIFNSCEAGAPGAMAQKLSEVTGLTTIGPEEPAHIEWIDVEPQGSRAPLFGVIYEDNGRQVATKKYH